MPIGTYTMLKPGAAPTWPDYSAKEGAYYYACGGSVATYRKASAIIILPTRKRLKGTGGGRNAYISFGVYGGDAGSIDIGLTNRTLPDEIRKLPGDGDDGFGWEAICYECGANKDYHFDTKKAPDGTLRAKLEVTPNLTYGNMIHLSVQWLDGNNNIINASKNLDTDITLTRTYAWTSFYRFASLVTNDNNASLSDSTYMLGGGFDSVKLGNTNWGISTDLVDTAWIINEPKCTLPYGYWTTGEEFRIDHWA